MERHNRWSFFVLINIGLMILLNSCGTTSFLGVPTEAPSEPFTTQWSGGNGLEAALAGFSRGYQPGQEYQFTLTLKNASLEAWKAQYCLQLVDRKEIIETLFQDTFTIQPGSSQDLPIKIRLPDYLAPSAYALGLAIPNVMTSLSTIYLGEESTLQTGPWVQPSCP